ncbi:hypothetical protein QYE76_008895 [Lolium multiflorum]|uniref:Uncharacterized protein n=1 Tax=Lolium multiflorum TaxID=4521 RepID=A0AAD8TU12_LOLMU|nr:hypothetical protein QYE76_008895 [Lolium multiflorum]
MSGEALKDPRFSHLARRNSAGEPMDMSPHPELKHHVEHLDFILHQAARQGPQDSSLRTKKDATITRLREKIAALEATIKNQEEQMKKMEEDGDDIQGGSAFLSDDDDFEEDENTEEEDYEFLNAGEDDHIAIDDE